MPSSSLMWSMHLLPTEGCSHARQRCIPLRSAQDLLCVGLADGIRAFDAATGAVRWHVRLPQSVIYAFWQDILFGVAQGHLLALRLTDGAVLWRSPVSVFSSTPGERNHPLRVTPEGIVYASLPGTHTDECLLCAYHARDGHLLWHHTLGWPDGAHYFITLPDLCITGQRGGLQAFSAADGTLLWDNPTLGSPAHSLVVEDNILYLTTTPFLRTCG